jgi:tetratricopeptide (TPR) repeat protein
MLRKWSLRHLRDGRPSRVAALFWLAVAAGGPATAADQRVADLLDHQHWKRARALVKPVDAQSFSQQARIDWAFYDQAAAIKHAEEAVKLAPDSADFHFHFAQILGEAAERAGFPSNVGLARRFNKEIDTALSLKPDDTFALFAKMLFLFKAPGMVGGDKAKAWTMAAQIEKIEPARGNFAYARLSASDKKIGQAADYYRKAIEINPRYYTVLVELAELHRTARPPDFTRAQQYARAAQRVEPDRIGGYEVLAKVFAATGRLDELDALLKESEANIPDDLAPHYYAADILVTNGSDPARAKRYLSQYLLQEPEARKPTHAAAQQLLRRAR